MSRRTEARDIGITLLFKVNGKLKKNNIPLVEVRELLNNNIGKEAIDFNFVVKNEMTSVTVPRITLENAIMQTMTAAIVPKNLSKYLVDITWALAIGKKSRLNGREHEIEKAWSCLARPSRCNAILVGPTGVGKNTIAIEMARQLAKGEAPSHFSGFRIIKFKALDFLKVEGKLKFKRLLSEITEFIVNSKERIILYIENFIYMKYEESLAFFLYDMVNKFNIKLIASCEEDIYEEYFMDDFEIAKYLNRIDVWQPELKDVYKMIKSDINQLKKSNGIDISDDVIKFAIYTSDLSETESMRPGNVITVFKWAFSNAKSKGKASVEKEDVLACYSTNFDLYEKMDYDEKKSTAYHELGHYIMHRLYSNVKNKKIAFVSILPMMDFLGVTWSYYLRGKQTSYTKKAYIDQIKMCLGGRAAEELFVGEHGDGIRADLEMANSLAEELIMSYGLSDNPKQVNRSYVSSGYFLKDYLFSDSLKDEFNREIKAIIDSAYEEVKKAIEENKELIEILVECLMEKEILTGEELEEICQKFEASKKQEEEPKAEAEKDVEIMVTDTSNNSSLIEALLEENKTE